MRKIALAVLSAALFAVPALAASQADYQGAYAKATQAAERAKSMGAAWTTTGRMLKDAQKAAADKQFDKATDLAKRAEALAHASIRQSVEQRTAWHSTAAIVK
jgi:excinuclease UvrABC nuclease subunit